MQTHVALSRGCFIRALYELPSANDRPARAHAESGSAATELAKRGVRPAPDQVCYLSAYRIADRYLRESLPDALGHFYRPLPYQGFSKLRLIGQFLEIS